MRNSLTRGVTARAKHAAVLAGVGVTLAPAAAFADAAIDAAAELSGVQVDAARQKPESPKFTAPLIDTPKAVTIIPQTLIKQTAAASLTDVLRNSPGVTFGAGEGGQPLADRPFIRGQASGNNVFVDNLRDTGGQVRDVFNLEQVEIVKGPDGAYNGRGSGGGSINLTTKKPKLDNFVNVTAAGGADAYGRGIVDANYQIGQTSALRLNLMGMTAQVPGRPDVVKTDSWGVAPSVAFGLGTDFRATASWYHLDTDGMPDYGVPLFTKIPGLTRAQAPENGVLNVGRGAFYGLAARDFQKTKADIGTVFVEHDLNDAVSIRNVFRHGRTLNDYLVTNPGDGGQSQLIDGQYWMKRGTKSRWNETTTTANLTEIYGDFATGAVKHSFDAGLELAKERNLNASYVIYTQQGAACPAGFTNNVTNAGVGDCTLVYAPNPDDPWRGTVTRPTPSQSTTKTAGLYVFDTLYFGDKWLLNLGARYDDYRVRGTNVAVTSAQGVITGQTFTATPKGQWDFVNYQAGLVYKPTADSSLYVSYGTSSTPPLIAGGDQNGAGSATGGGSGNANSNVVLDPEDSESFELGVKWALMGGKLSATGALFRMDRKNAQIQIESGVYAQAGKVRVQGLELGLAGAVTPKWDVFAGYAYMDSELLRGAYNSANIGDPLANTPKHSGNVFTTYEVVRKLKIGGGAYYVGKSFGGNQGGAGGGTNGVYAPSYWRFDAFASYAVNDRIDLQLNVQNVGDEDYIIRTNGVHHADYGPGRQAILTLNARF